MAIQRSRRAVGCKHLGRAALVATIACTLGPLWANPALTPGIWKNITPAALNMAGTFGTANIAIDPSAPSTLYAGADQRGLWKSTNGGETWVVLGDPNAPYNFETTTKYLDNPIFVCVDPANSLHMFCTQGARGATMGFWETTDGGVNWAMPAGFIAAIATIGTRDMTQMRVDPADFNHMIIGSHSAWKGLGNAGILETKDGGKTFIIHQPIAAFTAGSMALNFLYSPKLNIGDSRSWLVGTDGGGLYKTTDAGAGWTQVSTTSIPHGGASLYASATGVLYSGGTPYPQRSTDNGTTWQQISNLGYAYYYTVQGDGNYLYTMNSFADNGAKYNKPYYSSPESDGTHWAAYNPLGTGAQNFDNGPFTMEFDKVNRIMYSANWVAGLWALKVIDPVTVVQGAGKAWSAAKTASATTRLIVARNRVQVRALGGQSYGLRGNLVVRP
jgi:hypothetical protein